jgi:hypothetical protein
MEKVCGSTERMRILEKLSFELKYVLLLFLTTRAALLMIGVISRILLEPYHGKEYVWIYSKKLWLDIWGVWDTGWYLNIAAHGYSNVISKDPATLGQTNYAFFPLYPLLMRFLGKGIGSYYIAGIFLSNLFLIIAGIFLYKLVQSESDQKTAMRSIKYLFLFPVSFILSGVFTEALFVALAVLCFYYMRKKFLFIVGVSGFFLSLTRNAGFLIFVPLLLEYLKGSNLRIKKDILFLSLIPLGLFVFTLYNYHLTGDFIAFTRIQSAWGRRLTNPLGALSYGLSTGDLNHKFSAYFTLLTLLLFIAFYRKIGFSYWVYGIYSILIPLSTGTVISMPRYELTIFPLFILLAKLSNNDKIDQMISLFLALLQGFLMVFWSNGFRLII